MPSECLARSRRRTLRADIFAGRIDPRREGVGGRGARPASLLRVGVRRNGVGGESDRKRNDSFVLLFFVSVDATVTQR